MTRQYVWGVYIYEPDTQHKSQHKISTEEWYISQKQQEN